MKLVGKILTIVLLTLLYAAGWTICIQGLSDERYKIFTLVYLSLHMIVLIVFLIWSWL